MASMAALPAVTIGAVSGPAPGGGCELVLACDLAYAFNARCATIVSGVQSGASIAEAKRILTGSSGRPPETASAREQAAFASLFGTPDQHERMTAFLAANPADSAPLA